MQLHTLTAGGKKVSRRIGRGGKRGTFSGRGTKGQKARSGRRIRPQFRDILKKIPKRRGRGRNSLKPFGEQPILVNLYVLEQHFAAGDTISPKTLIEKGVITIHKGRVPVVKILGTGKLTKKFSVENCEMSKAAKEKIDHVK